MDRRLLIIVAAGVLTSSPGGAEPLRACFRDADLPRSARAGEAGFDVAVLRAVAAELSLDLVPVWLPSRQGFAEIEGSDLPLEALASGVCDVVASVPGTPALRGMRATLAVTRPYYGAGFELVGGPNSPSRLGDLENRRVGVRLQSLAHFAVQGLGLQWKARPTTAEVLALVHAQEVDVALVWGPELSAFRREPVPGSVPHRALRFNEHMALRNGDERLPLVDRTLATLLARGEMAALAKKTGLTYRPPFGTVSDRQALAAVGAGTGTARR